MDPQMRLEALAKDRDSLRIEVERLRSSLEEIQRSHDSELASLRGELEESQGEKEKAETQYENLLGKVNTNQVAAGRAAQSRQGG